MIIKDILFKNMLKAHTQDMYVGYKITAPFTYTVYTINEETGLYSVWDIKGLDVSLLECNLSKTRLMFFLNIVGYVRREEEC